MKALLVLMGDEMVWEVTVTLVSEIDRAKNQAVALHMCSNIATDIEVRFSVNPIANSHRHVLKVTKLYICTGFKYFPSRSRLCFQS